MINAATILGGPALVKHRGVTFYSQGDIKLESEHETFAIEVDKFGKVDERVSDESLKVSFQPDGQFKDLAIIWPYANTLLGTLMTPITQAIVSINTTSDVVTLTGHGYVTGDDVLMHVGEGGILPTATPAITNVTRVWIKRVDNDTFTLHPTAAEAAAGSNTINFSDDGTGTIYLDRDHPLVIHTFDGVKLTLFNAGISAMPGLNLSAIKTIFDGKTIEFEAFLRNGVDWSDNEARWKIENTPLIDTTFDPSLIITAPYSAAWGGSAPWSAFETMEGFDVNFNLGWEAVRIDSLGRVSQRLSSLEVSVTAQPIGITSTQLLQKLQLQGAGAARGRSLSGDDLVITCAQVGGPLVTIAGAALKKGPQGYSAKSERIGQLEWSATRTFSAGTPEPLFNIAEVEA